MQDCELIMHTASPFLVGKTKDPQKQLITPALEGTKNVLNTACKVSSVKRIVLTSSVAAVFGDSIDIKDTPNQIFSEDIWNTTSSLEHQPYSYSKTVAEKAAWEIANSQNKWDLITINPGFVLGPSLTNRVDSASIDFMRSMLNGKYKTGVPALYFGVTDVRDIARAHILAGEKASAKGRHIIVADSCSMLELSEILHKKFAKYSLPKMQVPKFVLYLVGPLQGFSWKFVKRNIGFPVKFDNSYSKSDLGLKYTSIETILHEHAEQLIKSGLI